MSPPEFTTPPQAAAPISEAKANPKDCLGCRIVGTTALVGTGLYGLGMARPGRPGSPLERRIMGVVGVGK